MIIGGKYQTIKELTRTTLSIVYECEHIIKKDKVVIKLEKEKKRLEKEAAIYLHLKKFRVNIPGMKGMGLHEDCAYLVLSQLKESLLTYKGSLPYVTFFKEIYYLHEASIVHRDIKPQNFLIGYKDDLFIIDFGLACGHSLVLMRSFVGNKRYASYVCFEETYLYDYKDDVISLIYMLLDMTFGFLPWDKEEKPRKEYDLKQYYPPHILLDLYDLCKGTFQYTQFFERLGSRVNGG